MKFKKTKENVFGEWLAICPVCNKEILERGMILHIKGRARGEL